MICNLDVTGESVTGVVLQYKITQVTFFNLYREEDVKKYGRVTKT